MPSSNNDNNTTSGNADDPENNPQMSTRYDAPCSVEQADTMIRKYNEHKVRLVRMLNDDWEQYEDTRYDAVRQVIFHATFYMRDNPTGVWNLLTNTPLYNQWTGGYGDVKKLVEAQMARHDALYGEENEDE